jgi:hypothetical protein
MASSLSAVNSNGVCRQVIAAVEHFRERLEGPTIVVDRQVLIWLGFNWKVLQRDAEYIVECLRVLLQQEWIAKRSGLSLLNLYTPYGGISDGAIDVFCGFLRATTCRLQTLWFHDFLPLRQVRRLLEALYTNRSVKALRIHGLKGDEGALWVADLLRHKIDFTALGFWRCRFSFAQILPLLRERPNLTAVAFDSCHVNNEDVLLFNEHEFTLLFVDIVLVSPSSTIKTLYLDRCGVNLENGPLMAGFHQNTTVVEITSYHGDEFRLFIDPILRRNRYLEHIHDMLGTRSWLAAAAAGQNIAAVNAIPPPCSIWPTVLAKVGRNGTQGASPVFTILQDRLVTWIEPYVFLHLCD